MIPIVSSAQRIEGLYSRAYCVNEQRSLVFVRIVDSSLKVTVLRVEEDFE